MPIVFVLLALIFVGLIGYLIYASTAARAEAWRTAAAHLGLHYHDGGVLSSDKIHGQLGGMAVLVDTYSTSSGKSSQTWTRVTVDLGGRVPPYTALGAENFWTRSTLVGGQDIEVGDHDFDAEVRIHGDPVWTRAVFDADTRRAIRNLVCDHEVKLSDGKLTWSEGGVMRDAQRIVQAVQALVATGQRLDLPRPAIPGSLRRNATRDPIAGVRHQALATLLGAFPGTPEATAGAREAASDPVANIRMLGASALGREGLPALETVLFEDASLPQTTLNQAFARAIQVATVAEAERFVLRALEPRHRRLWAAAADGAANRGLQRAVPALRSALDTLGASDPTASSSAARALGALGDTASEARLLALIDCGAERVEVAAIEALGQVGRLAVVEQLLPRTRGMFTAGDVKRAARAAISAIQARHGGGADGGLSLVDTARAGNLAVVEPHGVGSAHVVEVEEEEEQGA